MSASAAIALRLDHLDQAAQVLPGTSPAISGHLRSAQRRLAIGEGRAVSTPNHLQICSACGSSLILGWNCEKRTSKDSKKKRTRQDRLRRQDSPKMLLDVRCSRCDSVTKFDLGSPPTAREQKSKAKPVDDPTAKLSIKQPLDVKPEISPSGTPPVTSAIKKRSRNKKSSLQSMLESRKPATQAQGFGLGLADFIIK